MIHPQFDPVALSLGPVEVHWYGLMYLLAFAAAYGLAWYRSSKRDGWTTDMVSDWSFLVPLVSFWAAVSAMYCFINLVNCYKILRICLGYGKAACRFMAA